jgi:hypothetical protein
MSGMYKKSMWWLFLLLFGLTIGAIQSLGWWTRQASAQSQVSHSIPAGKYLQTCEPMHWRSMIMQQ